MENLTPLQLTHTQTKKNSKKYLNNLYMSNITIIA